MTINARLGIVISQSYRARVGNFVNAANWHRQEENNEF